VGAALDRVTAALSAAGSHQQRDGGDWTCPAHDDHNPSLSVSNGDGKVLIKCQAGCATEDVVTRIGLAMADLFDEPRVIDDRPRIVATYDYVDESGQLLFQAVRYDPKDFRQRRRDGNGGWVWNLKGTRRVVYRLPDVLEAAAAGGEIFVVEGEKDVEALERAGYTATCNPMGAGKWDDTYTRFLKGARRVLVVADKDEPGRAHATAVGGSLERAGIPYTVWEAAVGKDAADHLGAGKTVEEFEVVHLDQAVRSKPGEHDSDRRHVRLLPASSIEPRPVRWVWDRRLPLGSLSLLGGREGIGKSTVAYSLAASVTNGTMKGCYEGQPKAVIICATEDSWAHTIVPRLMAAGADLSRVFRADVVTAEGFEATLTLPSDIAELEQAALDIDAAVILLDPLMSRLDASLDSHRDAEVRRALEPLVKLAEKSAAVVLGLIHVNKSHSTDPLTLLMGSRAFAAVARAVLFAMADPDSQDVRYLGQPKNNLGRSDLPTLTYRIVSAHVADTDEGPVTTGRVEWLGEDERSIRDVLEASSEAPDVRTATGEAAVWLEEYLRSVGGVSASAKIKEEGKYAGHSHDALKRASRKLKVKVESSGFPRTTYWKLPTPSQSEQFLGESALTALNCSNCTE
jgi:5S rRNA maturation endonuclease (ribonuclease M5)